MKELICISCPIGCRLHIEQNIEDLKEELTGENQNANGQYKVTGNKCSRGYEYAVAEMTAPKRTVTSTVAYCSIEHPRIPVKTLAPFPKEDIPALLLLLNKIIIKKPLCEGDIILKNPLGKGIDVIATSGTQENG